MKTVPDILPVATVRAVCMRFDIVVAFDISDAVTPVVAEAYFMLVVAADVTRAAAVAVASVDAT